MNEINNDDEYNKDNILQLKDNRNENEKVNEGNIKVNNITMKKVDDNFSNAQKVILTNDNKVTKEEKKEIEKKNTEKSIKEIQEIKSNNSQESEEVKKKKATKKLRTQSTKAPPGMLKKKKGENTEKKKSGLFLCCIPRSSGD